MNLTQHDTTTLPSVIIVHNHTSLLKILRLFMVFRRFGGRESPLSSLSCHVRSINLQTKNLVVEAEVMQAAVRLKGREMKDFKT